jgi:2,5-diketo-D-gluconate reductase B
MAYVNVRGRTIPAIGLGTWRMTGKECTNAVASALDIGYRHIDTAQMYDNEGDVGLGIRQSGVDRGDVWLTTKLWPDSLSASGVHAGIDASLSRLKTDYVDLLLIHWPNPHIPLRETLDAFAEVQAAGKTRNFGVSNFPVSMLREAVEVIGADIICDQVEYHPMLSQKRVMAYAKECDIMVTAYCPLGRGNLDAGGFLRDIGVRYGKTPYQVALRWLIQQGRVAAIPKSANRTNQRANLDIFDFELSIEDMNRIHENAGQDRLVNMGSAPDWDPE